MKKILVIGNSDGIGLAVTKELLANGYDVVGVSRSPSPITQAFYNHVVCDVISAKYKETLASLQQAKGPFDVCIYCAGIGHTLDPNDLSKDVRVFQVNLMGAMFAAEVIIPTMTRAGAGHFVVLSSLGDEMLSSQVPSYFASKAAMSSYFEGLALAVRPFGVFVTNVRFGFVDTKMAKGNKRPFMISPQKASSLVMRCLRKRPVRFSYPKRMAIFVRIARWLMNLRIRFS
ncbi:MAG: SDR family NAD(P)-dependent oxidoreductase [Pseudomonadota bacterium]